MPTALWCLQVIVLVSVHAGLRRPCHNLLWQAGGEAASANPAGHPWQAGNLSACVLPPTEACRMNRTCTVAPTLEPRVPVDLRLLPKGSRRQAVVSERKLWLQVTGARRNTAGARHVILYAEAVFTVMQYSSGRPRRHPSWQSSQPCKSSHANCSMEQLSRTHHPTRQLRS